MDSRQESPRKETASFGAIAIVALLIGVSFWSVGNKIDQSVAMREEMQIGFHRAENQHAVRQKETTASTAFGFLLLAGTGAACWSVAPPNRLRWNTPLLWLAMLFFAWAGFSLLWSIEPIQTVRKLAILGLMLIASVGFAAKFDLEEFLEIIVMVIGGIALIGILAEIRYGTMRPWQGIYRFSGTMHPNDQGLNCAILALAAWMLEGSPRFGPTTRKILVLAGLAGLWFSKSRTTLAAFVIAGVVYLVLRSRGSQRWLVFSAALTLAGVGGLLYNFVSVSVLKQTTNVAEMGRHDNVSSLTGRLPLWEELLRDAKKRPLAGHGYGGFWGAKNILTYSERNHWHIPHAHNTYLDLVLAIGVIGLVLYVVWVVSTAAAAAVRYERTGRVGQLFVVCALVFSLVHGATESKIPSPGLIGFSILTLMMMEAIQRSAWQEPGGLSVRRSGMRRVLQPLAPRAWPGITKRAPQTTYRP
jgi:O-antigen ligase